MKLSVPTFVKVADLLHMRSGYNVKVNIIEAHERIIDTRRGDKMKIVNCVVGDETALVNAFFKGDNTTLIKEGNVIAIRNGVKRFFKRHICLEIDLFGRVTEEKQNIVATAKKNISDKEYISKHLKDRTYERRRVPENFQKRNIKEKQFTRTQERKSFQKLKQIHPGQEGIKIIVKVIEITGITKTMVKCVLGDETAIVDGFLPKIAQISVGQSIFLSRAQAKVFQEHIELQARRGLIDRARNQIRTVNMKENMSSRSWVLASDEQNN